MGYYDEPENDCCDPDGLTGAICGCDCGCCTYPIEEYYEPDDLYEPEEDD